MPQTITISSSPIILSNAKRGGEAIDGTASNGLTFSGGGTTQIFSVSRGATATLRGLTFSGGYAATSDGAIANAGNLTINDSTLTGNSVGQFGGSLSVTGGTFRGNTAFQGGARPLAPPAFTGGGRRRHEWGR